MLNIPSLFIEPILAEGRGVEESDPIFWRDDDGEETDNTPVEDKADTLDMRGFKVEPVNIDNAFMAYNQYSGNLEMKGLNQYTIGKYLLSFRITDYLNNSVTRYFELNFVGSNLEVVPTNTTLPFDYDAPMDQWDKSKSNYWLVNEAELS